MASDTETSKAVPDPHDELARLRAEFDQSATALERVMARFRCYIGAPTTTVVAVAGILVWTLWNAVFGTHAFDPAPYPVLNTIVSVSALIATTLILAGQRREDEAAKRLHLAAESEQKIAKLIQLVEEQRRDSAVIPNRDDAEAEQMSSPAGPRAVLERLENDQSV